MDKKTKVFKGFDQCTMVSSDEGYETQCHDCPYFEEDISLTECREQLRKDLNALLKEQHKLIDEITQRRANNGAFD